VTDAELDDIKAELRRLGLSDEEIERVTAR
jgi:hypothetical protein